MKTFLTGQRIGAYNVLRRLGAEGSRVYEVEHATLGFKRALKIFPAESEDLEILLKGFVAQQQALTDLQPARLVRVYDYFTDEGYGVVCFDMDLILSPSGHPCTLEEKQKEGSREWDIVGWFRDICECLAYLHSHGIVHGGISLDKVLIGADGHAVVASLGAPEMAAAISCKKLNAIETESSNDVSCARMDIYMAPELRNKDDKLTFASDAWAVGILIFRLLSSTWCTIGMHIEDWLSDFEYDWQPVLSRLCNLNPRKRLGLQGIGVVPKLLLKQTFSDIAHNNRNIWIETLTVSLAIIMLSLTAKYRNIIWLLAFVAIYFTVKLALKYKEYCADKNAVWRAFNSVQWIDLCIVGVGYPLVAVFHFLLKRTPSLWFSVLALAFLVWRICLRLLTSQKIRWAYRAEMALLSMSFISFAFIVLYFVYMVIARRFSAFSGIYVSLPKEVICLYLVSPLVPITWCLGMSKYIRKTIAEAPSRALTRGNTMLRVFYGCTTMALCVYAMLILIYAALAGR